MKVKITLSNFTLLFCFLIINITTFTNAKICYLKNKHCDKLPPIFNDYDHSTSTLYDSEVSDMQMAYVQYQTNCPIGLTECFGNCMIAVYSDAFSITDNRRLHGCIDDVKNDFMNIFANELGAFGNLTEAELFLDKVELACQTELYQRFAVKDPFGSIYQILCCHTNYCNDLFHVNCYLSDEVWQNDNYEIGRHFPLNFCAQLHFSLGYKILSFMDFLKDSDEFKQHLDKLPMPTKKFLAMILTLKNKLLTKIFYSIGTVNNPFNQHDLALQIEEEFQQAIGNDMNRQRFANNFVIFRKVYSIEGIDISHPYPNMSAINDFYYRVKYLGHLTLFPSPKRSIYLPDKVKEDKVYFNEIQKNSVSITLAYDMYDMMDFLRALHKANGHLKFIFLGTKYMFYNQTRKYKFNFNGTLYELCQKVWTNAKFENGSSLSKYRSDDRRLMDISHQTVILMRHYDLGGLSAMFLDWVPSDCGGERFAALERLNTMLHFIKSGKQFFSNGLNFIMDFNELEKEIHVEYDRQLEKLNFLSTPYKFIVGILIAFVVILAILLIIYKAFFVENMIYFKELPNIFVEMNYDLYSKHFVIIKRIGNGAFSNVYLIKYIGPESVKFDSERCCLISTLPNKKFAAKVIKVHQHRGEVHILREFERMRECTHEFIVKAYGVTLLQRQIAVVMEYLPNGNLLEHLKHMNEFPSLEIIISWCLCIVKAMKYLHAKQQPILHRDLAARNCLFIDNEKRQLKIGDFGLARNAQYGPGCDSSHYEGSISTSPLAWAWVAKEIVCSGTDQIFFTKESDVWSFGILLWEICSLGKAPYPVSDPYDRIAVKNWLERQGVPKCPRPDAQMIYDNLITPCWLDPLERITFDELEELIENGTSLNPPTRMTTTQVLDPNPSTSNTASTEKFTTATIEENALANSSTTISNVSQPNLPDGIKILPAKKIAFNAPFVYPCCMKITNSGENPIFYQLKTTNSQRLHMDPVNGILKPNGSVNIAVTCESNEGSSETMENDCITVEWINKTEEMQEKEFQPEWFQNNEMVRRKDLAVEYNM